MPKNDAPTYTDEELIASSELLAPYNPFDMYVEDISIILLYEQIVKNICPGFDSFKPIALSGRDAVINAAKSLSNDFDRKRLFIIDGDAPFILGEEEDLPKDTVRLNCYSIENIIYAPELVAKAMSLSSGKISADEFMSGNTFKQLATIMQDFILPLSIMFAIQHSLKTGSKNLKTRLSGVIMISKDNCKLRRLAYSKIYNASRIDIDSKIGKTARKAAVSAHIKRIKTNGFDYRHIIPGKFTIAPTMVSLWQKTGPGVCSIETLAAMIAPHCKFSLDPLLYDEIQLRSVA